MKEIGGAEGDRTPGLDSAIVALSQLSYSPINSFNGFFPLPQVEGEGKRLCFSRNSRSIPMGFSQWVSLNSS